MNIVDARGCRLSGATPAALPAYERALAAFVGWRAGTEAQLALALQAAPGFVMALALQAYLLLCSRDARRVRSARPLLQRAAALPADARERLHLAAIAAVLDDDYGLARQRLGEVLRGHPRDLLALQVAHAFDHLTGDVAALRDRAARVLRAWPRDLPGRHGVLAMQAFGLVECGEYRRAERAAHAALALEPRDARAHHVMAHVFEMTDRPQAGARWLQAHAAGWSGDTLVATHVWWHLALFHLAQGEPAQALAVYDARLRAGGSVEVADLIDAAALQWRLQLDGVDSGARAFELADAWAPHLDDGFCSFSDLHAMLAFVAARDWHRAERLERSLQAAASRPTRHGATTRLLGLPACRALIAFGRGDNASASALLASLPALAHRLGGSHAQRDVLHLTALRAIQRLRRPVRRPRARHPLFARVAASAPIRLASA